LLDRANGQFDKCVDTAVAMARTSTLSSDIKNEETTFGSLILTDHINC